MTDNIDPVEFGEMRSDIKNISSTTQRIELLVGAGFEKQDKVNKSLSARITQNKNKIIYGTGLVAGFAVALKYLL